MSWQKRLARRRARQEPSRNGTGAGAAPPVAQDAYTIILAFFREQFRPVFRRGPVIYSAALGREVKMGEACSGAAKELIDRLKTATNAARGEGGIVKLNALPQLFNSWSRSAWVDLVASLPDEEGAEATDAAAEEFRGMVRRALLSQVTLGETISGRGEDVVRTERRSLADWCSRFAKPGPWRSIRSYCCWCRQRGLPDGEVELEIAVRAELFGQVTSDRRLVEMGPKRFARQASLYGVGLALEDERPQGRRAVRLDSEFVRDLLSSPHDPLPTDVAGGME